MNGFKRKTSQKLREGVIEGALFISALFSVVVTVSIVGILTYESYGFFSEVSLKEFFTEKTWAPLFSEPKFCILPLVMLRNLLFGRILCSLPFVN